MALNSTCHLFYKFNGTTVPWLISTMTFPQLSLSLCREAHGIDWGLQDMISLIGGQPARDQAIVTSNGVRILSGREGRLGRNLVTDYHWKWSMCKLIYILKIAIFHSYVSLPEGKWQCYLGVAIPPRSCKIGSFSALISTRCYMSPYLDAGTNIKETTTLICSIKRHALWIISCCIYSTCEKLPIILSIQ